MSSRDYIKPIILASEMEKKRRIRTIQVNKEKVFKDIDLITHKHVDAREEMGVRSINAVSSDHAENVDGAVIARYVEFRDAELRTKIQFALSDLNNEYADDKITLDENIYTYHLMMPEKFNDNVLRPLAEYFHRYLVWGALHDWYMQFGMAQLAVAYDTDGLLRNIVNTLRGSTMVKRPLQPFGPAVKFRE